MWVMDDCSIYVICWPAYWFLAYGEISPSLCFLAFWELQRFGFFPLPRPYNWSRWTSCSSTVYCTLSLLRIFSYICFLLPVLPSSFSVSWFSHLCHWKTLHAMFHVLGFCSHRSLLVTSLNTNHSAHLLASLFPAPGWVPYMGLSKTPVEQCLLCITFSKDLLNEWMNEWTEPHGFHKCMVHVHEYVQGYLCEAGCGGSSL